MRDRTKALKDNLDLIALTGLFAAPFLLPRSTPPGVIGLGVTSGAALALNAIGMILVFRSNRVINFAHVPLGIVTGVLFRLLVEQRSVLRGLGVVCPPCIDRFTPGSLFVNFWISLLLSLVFALAASYLIYALIGRRFARAPRMVATVATIGVAGVLASIQSALPGLLATADQRELSSVPQGVAATPPFDISFTLRPTRFDASDILLVAFAVVALVGAAVFFRKTSTGIAIRAAADNRQRALTLGMDVDRIVLRVWLLSGLLAGAVAVISAMGSPSPEAGLSVSATVRILAVAVAARLTSLPIAALAGLGVGIFDQTSLWSFGSVSIADGSFILVIAVVLVLQRYRTSRAEEEASSEWKSDREQRSIPPELRSLPGVRTSVRLGFVLLVLVLAGSPWALSPSQTNYAAVIMIYAMVGLSLLILTGWAGQISLGQFAFAATGGYVASMLSGVAGWPLLPALLVAAGAGATVALVVGLPALKLRGLHLAVTTMAFALAVSSILLNPTHLGRHLPDLLKRPAFLGVDLADQRTFYYFTLTILILVLFGVVGVRRSRAGRALIAGRDNELAAQSFGIDLIRVRLAAFALSGFIAALAGGLFAFHQSGVQPAAYAPEVSVTMFLLAVIGGMGSVAGPVLGATYLGVLNLMSTRPVVVFLATGGGLLLLLSLAPGGLAQMLYQVRDGMLKRVAVRQRIVVPSLLADVSVDPLGERAPIEPKVAAGGGGKAFVPLRYRLEGQWALSAPVQDKEKDAHPTVDELSPVDVES